MKSTTRNEATTALVVGALGGILLQFILTNVFPQVTVLERSALFIICLIGSPVGLTVLIRTLPKYKRFFRFALVGALNVAFDVGLLNLQLTAFGQKNVNFFPLFASVSFFAATVNSFFWNKHWVFGDRESRGAGPVAWFYFVNAVGFFVNVGIATGLVRFLPVPPHLSVLVWENAAKAAGIGAALITNFFGYKYLAFREEKTA